MIQNVLLVDYDPRSIRRLRGLLQQEGVQTLLATNGNAGIDAARICHPDLVVVQDLVPGRHGFEVCREIKNGGNGTAPPVLLLFTPRPGRRTVARSCGCDSILEKPFDDLAFVTRLRSLLGVVNPEPEIIALPEVVEADPEIQAAVDQLFAPSPDPEPPKPVRKRRRRSPSKPKKAGSRRSKRRKETSPPATENRESRT